MDSSQDLAINTLTVLDDAGATGDRTGCAVFNGGINVVKNIITCDLDAAIVVAQKAKITCDMSVQRNLYVDGCILPFTNYSTASLGSSDKKWNNIHAICADIVQVNSNMLSTKSICMENMKVSVCTINITDTVAGTPTYNITLETGITVVNLTSTYDTDRIVIMTLPLPTFGTNHDIKKIIFKQNKCNNIKWIYNTTEYILGNSYEQIFDLINIDGTWRLVNYTDADKKITSDNSSKIDIIQTSQDVQDASLNTLTCRLDALVDLNHFLSITDSSENTILDFVDKNVEIADDILGLRTSVNTIASTLACVNGLVTSNTTNLASLKASSNAKSLDLSGNLAITNNVIDVFKSVTNITFNNINTKMLYIDSSLSNLTLKSSEASLDIKRARELIDLVDKKLCDHISNTDAKMAFLNDSIKHLNEKMDLVMGKCGIHFH
jgi:hypothetical protein